MSDLFPAVKDVKDNSPDIFYDDKGLKVGHPKSVMLAAALFAVAFLTSSMFIVYISLPILSAPYDSASGTLPNQWLLIGAMPKILASQLYVFVIPLVASIVSFFSKGYTKRFGGLWVFSMSLAILIVWVLMVLNVNGILM